MSRKSPIMISRSFFLLIAAATALFAGHAAAGNKPTQPLTPAACLAAGIKPPVGFFGEGNSNTAPNVQFHFLIGAGKPESCPLINVKVTWLYHIADKKTQANVKTVSGSTTFPQTAPDQWARLTLDCTPPGANTYCKDASATIASGSGYVIINGKGSASVGPLKP
jgi:uncharacterized Zn-binding protein involved in type VI secretion